MVVTIHRHADRTVGSAKIGRWLAGLALAPVAFRFFGSVGVWLDLVHLAPVATWITGTVYPSVRILHFRASIVSWVVSVLVGACVAGLWAGIHTRGGGVANAACGE